MSDLIKGQCPTCKGNGWWSDPYYGGSTCSECDGLGIILTDKGEDIMILINSARQRARLEERAESERRSHNDF